MRCSPRCLVKNSSPSRRSRTGCTSSAATRWVSTRSLDAVGRVATHLSAERFDGLFDTGAESTNVLVVATTQRRTEGDDYVVATLVGSVEIEGRLGVLRGLKVTR